MSLSPSPAPSGTRSFRTAPVLAAVTVAAATAVVAVVSPEEPGTYPACPFHTLTGWWCPACGSLRAVHALTHGDLATAIDRNVLLVLAVPVLVLAWASWLRRPDAPRTGPRTGRGTAGALVATVLAFWVLRNLPAGSWLAP